MAAKNYKKREEIMSAAYDLFSNAPYDRVSLSDISNAAGINKSLLQHYYSQKSEIIKTMLSEMLNVSFSYMDVFSYQDEDLFQKISDFNMLFFKGSAADYRLGQFLLASVSSAEMLDTWIDTICAWLRRYCGVETFSYLQLRCAMCFSMGGSMHIFQHKDELGIDYRFICRKHIWAILSFLNYDPQRIGEICSRTDDRISRTSADDFLCYCRERLVWMTV